LPDVSLDVVAAGTGLVRWGNSDDFMLAMPLLSGGSFGTGAGAGEGEDLGADCERLRESFDDEEDDALRLSALLVER